MVRSDRELVFRKDPDQNIRSERGNGKMRVVSILLVLGCMTCLAIVGASLKAVSAQSGSAFTKEQLEVLSVEEQYRQARLRNDLKALDRVLTDDYSGTNQNGHIRNKAETRELFKSFKLKSLSIEKPQVVVHSDTAVVSGFQTELLPDSSGPARLRFVRVYVKQVGRWQLLASQQMNAPPD